MCSILQVIVLYMIEMLITYSVWVESYMSVARCIAILYPTHARSVLTLPRTRGALGTYCTYCINISTWKIESAVKMHILDCAR